MWPTFGNSSISVGEVVITSILYGFDQKNLQKTFKKFYTIVTKVLKLKVRKFWGLIPTFAEVTEENLVGWEGFLAPHLE